MSRMVDNTIIGAIAAAGALKSDLGHTHGSVDAPDMIGAANSAWVSLIFEAGSTPAKINSGAIGIRNVDGTDQGLNYVGTLPTNRGGKKLYIKGFRVSVMGAIVGNFVDSVTLYGRTTSTTSLQADNTDRTSPGLYTKAFAAEDMSGYYDYAIWIFIEVAGASLLSLSSVQVDAYYDD